MDSAPVIKEKKGISPVWTLPIIALCICGWIIYSSYQNAGIQITIFFEDATGITPGKTQVISRGIPIGTVTEIQPDLDNRRIKTVVKLDKGVAGNLMEDTLFWVVRPEISAARVQGLDTLLSGSYIGIQPGHSTISSREFIGLSSPPPISEDAPGLHLDLRANALGSIQNGSGVYYRNITIGSVTKHSLENDNSILIKLHVEPEYAHLVREGSRFCNASGVSISGKLTNLKVQVESLASLIKGGIVLHTPEALALTPAVKNGHIFKFYKDLDSATYGLNMTLQLASSTGITEGETKVIYRGLVAGVVEKIEFNEDERHTVTAHIMLDPRAGRILRQETQFWIVRPEINAEGIKNIHTLLSGPYITFIPGEGQFRKHFQILPEPPPQQPLRPGSELVLTAPESYSIHKGAPVTFKNKKVGEILGVELDAHFKNFEILIFIYEQYEKLVKPSSVFWNSSGVAFDASLSGVNITVNSLSAALSGGISFTTPEMSDMDEIEQTKEVIFFVYKNLEDALAVEPNLLPPGYRFRLQTEDPKSYNIGTKIYFKNVQVGQVIGITLSQNRKSVFIDCIIDEQYVDTINSSSRFYDLSGVSVEGSLSGISMHTGSLEAIVTGGIGFFSPEIFPPPKNHITFPLFPSKKTAESVDDIVISVRFKECKDLQQGSPVKYKGVKIGEVLDLGFAENMEEIVVYLQIMKEAQSLFRHNTKIWLEKAEASLSGIKNLKTILFGPYINVLPGIGAVKKNFIALTGPPPTPADTSGGLDIILVTPHRGSLKINSPISYRQVKIGRVVDFKLSDDFKQVLVNANIEEQYAPIVRENTRFWVASGTRIKGGLFSGITVSTESLEAMLIGGIALATPGKKEMGNPVNNNHHFNLYDKAEDGWSDWKPDIILVEEEKNTNKDI